MRFIFYYFQIWLLWAFERCANISSNELLAYQTTFTRGCPGISDNLRKNRWWKSE